METKHLIALPLIFGLTAGGTVLLTLWQRARDFAFFLLVACAVLTERLDVHFFSTEWYRGTTRGVEVSLLDILALSLLAASWLAPRYAPKRWYWPASLGLMMLYFLDCGFSTLISEPKIYGLFELTKVFRGIIIFLTAAMFVRTKRELITLITALGCAVCFEGALAIEQHLSYGLFRVPGSLDHPNSLSMYLCLVSPMFVAAAASDLPRWLRGFCLVCCGVAALSILRALSRAGVPIFAFVMMGTAAWCVSWRITMRKAAMMAAIALGAGLLLFHSWGLLQLRYGQSTLAEEYLDPQSEGRGVYFRYAHAILAERFLGVGLNNWSYWVSKVYGPRLGFPYEDYDTLDLESANDEILKDAYLAAPAHNLAALTVGELGVPGLLLFGLVWLRWFQMGASFLWRRVSDPMHRLGVGIFFGTAGIFLQSMTEWTYRQTSIMFTFHLMLGALASLYYHKRHAAASAVAEVDFKPVEIGEWEPIIPVRATAGR
jgi:hypothetical protein